MTVGASAIPTGHRLQITGGEGLPPSLVVAGMEVS